jgi:hypothetical protein
MKYLKLELTLRAEDQWNRPIGILRTVRAQTPEELVIRLERALKEFELCNSIPQQLTRISRMGKKYY